MSKFKLLKLVTVPDQLDVALRGQMSDLTNRGADVYMGSSFDNTIAEIVLREGVPHFEIPFVRDISIVKDLWALFKLIKLLSNLKPDIVHTQSPKAGFIGMLASRITNVPVRIHTVAGLPLMESNGIKKKVLIFIEKVTYKLATSVIVNSLNLQKYITSHIYNNPCKVKVLGYGSSNGVDLEYFLNTNYLIDKAALIKNEFNILPYDFVWCFVGRIVKDKGIEELIDCFEEIIKTRPNSKLLLLGSFEKKNAVKPSVKERILNNRNIIYFGHCKDIRPYLSLSNAFVFPSYREGLPDSLIQACCFNLPSVATDINGCNEIILNNENGLLVKPKNQKDLLEKMLLLQDNIHLQLKFGEKTRAMIELRFSQKVVWDLQYLEYCNLLNSHI